MSNTHHNVQIKNLSDLYTNHIKDQKKIDINSKQLYKLFCEFFEERINSIKASEPNNYWTNALADSIEFIAAPIFETEKKFIGLEFWHYFNDKNNLEDFLLQGAKNWYHFTSGGCGLVYNEAIAYLFGMEDLKKKWINDEIDADWLRLESEILKEAFEIFFRICQDFRAKHKFSVFFS